MGPEGFNWSDDLCAVIRLDAALNLNGRNIEWLIVVPRHRGYGLYSLCWTRIAVYIHALERPISPQQLSWNDISAICSIKLANKFLSISIQRLWNHQLSFASESV
jgi:hypothetical protein